MTFNEYLKDKNISTNSSHSYQNAVNRFTTWYKKQDLQLEQLGYNDITAYMSYLKTKGNKQRTVGQELNGIKHFLNYQVSQGIIPNNYISHIKIQGVARKQLHTPIKQEELDYLYEQYPIKKKAKTVGRKANPHIQKRNKVLLGLLIYQGISTTDLNYLKVAHIDLVKTTVQLVGSRKIVGRSLRLDPVQILDIQYYLDQSHSELQHFFEKDTDQFIFSQGKGIYNILTKLQIELQEIVPHLKYIRQIRTAVITQWLKQYNLREAQYRAGHRYVSSTENYRVNDIESLQQAISQFSPQLGDN